MNLLDNVLLAQEQLRIEEVELQSPGPVFWILYFALFIFFIVTMWKVYTKAGKPGWASIIPLYNLIVLFQIAGKPAWWVILLIIPIVNLIILVLVFISIAEKFGKGVGFALGLMFLGFIFFPILAFSDAKYRG